jgi:hypothetical protein
MARIRSVKPEFWTDEKIIKLSIPARLFFIGLWNFADDNGVLENKPLQLKIRIFPMDNVKIKPLLEELINLNIIISYEVEGESFLWIKHLNRHQIIDRPRKANLPEPPQDIKNTHQNTDTEDQLKSTDINVGKDRNRKEYKKQKKFIPVDFKISNELRQWASKNGYFNLEEHLEWFKDYALANSKKYADWDAAFRNCIKGDWGKIRQMQAASRPPSPKPRAVPRKDCPQCRGKGIFYREIAGVTRSRPCDCLKEQSA